MVTAAVSKAATGASPAGFDSSVLRTSAAKTTGYLPDSYSGSRGSTPWRRA